MEMADDAPAQCPKVGDVPFDWFWAREIGGGQVFQKEPESTHDFF